MSMHQVPSQSRCEAIRCSSAAITRRYWARFGTSIFPIVSAAMHVRELARHRRHVVGLRRDRGVLRVGQRFRELFVTPVQVADHRVDPDDRLAFEREDGAEHPVRGRVLRPHVHREALAARVLEFDLAGADCAGHPSTSPVASVSRDDPEQRRGVIGKEDMEYRRRTT